MTIHLLLEELFYNSEVKKQQNSLKISYKYLEKFFDFSFPCNAKAFCAETYAKNDIVFQQGLAGIWEMKQPVGGLPDLLCLMHQWVNAKTKLFTRDTHISNGKMPIFFLTASLIALSPAQTDIY